MGYRGSEGNASARKGEGRWFSSYRGVLYEVSACTANAVLSRLGTEIKKPGHNMTKKLNRNEMNAEPPA